MTFKTTAAALALLAMLTGVIDVQGAAAQTLAHDTPQARTAFPLGSSKGLMPHVLPLRDQAGAHRAFELHMTAALDSTIFGGTMLDAAKQADHATRVLVPQPRALLLLGLGLLLFGLRRRAVQAHNKRSEAVSSLRPADSASTDANPTDCATDARTAQADRNRSGVDR